MNGLAGFSCIDSNRAGYSPSAAIRRIESARLLREIPEVASKTESGALNLSQLSQLQHATRQVQKMENRKVAPTEKMDLLAKIENTTQSKTELILAQELSLPVIPQNKEILHRDESVTLTLTFTKEQMALLEKASDLISHAVPDKKWADILTYLANKEVRHRTGLQKRSTAASAKVVGKDKLSKKKTASTFKQPEIRPLRKPIPASLRKSILQNQPSCQYSDPTSGRVCASTRFLQIDHIESVCAGGGNERENLQTLCSQHNRFKFRNEKFIP